MMIPFRKAKTFKQMTPSQRASFEKSYASYEKYYNKMSSAYEPKLTKDEYFEAYKSTYNELKSQRLTTAAIPRQVAAEQKYERSWAQDRAQFKALKETENFKKMHGEMIFKEFRQIQSDDLAEFLWDEIEINKSQLLNSGMNQAEVNTFISQYYFGSP